MRIAVLLLVVFPLLFYFFIPGAWLGGIRGISEQSRVIVRQTTTHQTVQPSDTVVAEVTFDREVVEHTLNPEQIRELKAFFLASTFTRSLSSTLIHNVANIESYNQFDILIYDEYFIAAHDSPLISITFGYFMGFRQSGNGWLRINNARWEEAILNILSLS
jgi:hypothetical protein